MKLIVILLTVFSALFSVAQADNLPVVTVGSKNFTESYVLAEILAQKIEASGVAHVRRRFGMGGTGILYESLKAGEIDVYPEYTGTLTAAILKADPHTSTDELRALLQKQGLGLSASLGFNNSYGLAVRQSLSRKESLTKISQLKDHPNLRMAFSYEFMRREDGFPALTRHYDLHPHKPLRMDHSLVYASIAEGKADVIEVYTTDSKIKKYNLRVLEDDKNFFPKYEGVFLFNDRLLERVPGLEKILKDLEGSLTDERMIELNSLVELENFNFQQAATSFVDPTVDAPAAPGYFEVILKHTKRHLLLVLLPTLISILIGVPLGVLAAKVHWVEQGVLMVTGLVQTIPSLALLCFLIPVFGIGLLPSMVALVLYGLLPIVRNTHSGLKAIEPRHHEVAKVLGLGWAAKLFRIEFPMAAIHILGGIKTAAIVNVGMATLAAFIGAGGYGALIVTGLALNDNHIILQGALPAAGMAIVVHFFFEVVDHWLRPKGLR